MIKDDKTMTKHRVKVQFNDPPEDHYVEVIGHLFGPYTEKMKVVQEEFIKECGDDVTFLAGNKVGRVFVTL